MEVRHAAFNVYREGSGGDAVFGDIDFDYARFGIEWLCRVEDEVANAIIDRLPLIVFHGLHRVCMVTNEDIGTGSYQTVGLQAL